MNFLYSAILSFLWLLEVLIFVDAIMSWFIRSRSNGISRAIGVVVDPILKPCNKIQTRLLPKSPVDFSPVIALFIIEFVKLIFGSIF